MLTYQRGGEGGFGGANGVAGGQGEWGLGNIIGYLAEGRLNLGFGGNFWVGEDFRAVGGGVWRMVGFSKCSPTCQ